ncbi:AAA family ATPase [Sphingobacterium sp.]|uniref:AAA family ATPase n=1 Tax=Sphingobacterium sp. TaxID=341027 RepID=UPI00258DAEC8|nr:AAA family ATPase [Sphingobacterium sp.]WET68785.1 MAG: AAA family ATPase [Sphingobacterium sp.]
MKLKKFTANNVHGFLDFNIDFDDELTFLIGINGSGKTSVLKLILGLTTPSYHHLSSIDYDYCEIYAFDNNRHIIISAHKEDETHFKIHLEIDGILEKTSAIKRNIEIDNQLDEENESYGIEKWRSVFSFESVVKKIRSMETPKFLGLERRLLDEFGLTSNTDQFYRFRKRIGEKKLNPKSLNPIDSGLYEVQILVNDYIRNIAQKQPLISKDFKDKIFKQSFNFLSDLAYTNLSIKKEKLEERKDNVIEAVKKLDLEYLVGDVENYFSKMIELTSNINKIIRSNSGNKQNEKSEEKVKEEAELFNTWFNNSPQLKKIDEIIEFSKEYQDQLEELRTPIKKLEKIASDFLSESNKSLKIAPDGEIIVEYKNGNSADLYKLSSGEKQIIIMIAHLIFAEHLKNAGVFIIDEPELSLHISWQEIFVDSIQEASPNTQFILATHSPSIISKISRENLCQDISDSYNA